MGVECEEGMSPAFHGGFVDGKRDSRVSDNSGFDGMRTASEGE